MNDDRYGDRQTASREPTAECDGAVGSSAVRTDGGGIEGDEQTRYLEAEVNIFRPSTPFMRDHLRIIWTGFIVWALIVFGPVTLTAIVPGVMTTQLPVIGFPLHYFLVAIGAPGGALLLSIWYARERDKLDEEYGIEHETAAAEQEADAQPAAADGGTSE